ncbi:MAG: carbon starvation protein [Streptococcaceae bacterium]|nr:carbon starvation protein [Streptococcaceae bacterium]
MNKELNTTQKSRLYGLTAIVCAIWLGQSLFKANHEDQLFSVYNVIFYICLLLVIAYTAFSAYQMWKQAKSEATESTQDNPSNIPNDSTKG